MTYELKNEFLRIKINKFGAELSSIVNLENSLEYLWQADPVYWKRHAPVLFPFVGSLKNKQYIYEGKSYTMGQHGFARDLDFEKISQSPDSLWQVLTANEVTHKNYPFEFKLEIGYKLEDKKIKVIWKITNLDDKIMHYSIGAHPAFNCPLHQDEQQTDCYIGFETKQSAINYKLVNDAGLLKNEMHTLPLENGYYKVTPTLFDRDALVIENHQVQKVCLADKDKKPYVTVNFDAPLFGIWSPAQKSAPFICIEPWYGRCDSADFNGTLEARQWGNKLMPSETQSMCYEIIIH